MFAGTQFIHTVAAAAILILSPGCGSKPSSLEDLGNRDIVLPGGQVLRVETMTDVKDTVRGLMFRPSLAPDRGMLFVYAQPGNLGFWTYQINFPLDMIWIDSSKHIVEIVANAPPCKTAASKCPSFGGTYPSQFVLQIAGGMAKKYGLHVGDALSF